MCCVMHLVTYTRHIHLVPKYSRLIHLTLPLPPRARQTPTPRSHTAKRLHVCTQAAGIYVSGILRCIKKENSSDRVLRH